MILFFGYISTKATLGHVKKGGFNYLRAHIDWK